MHFPEAVHLGQSEASQLVSVQLLDRKISLWLMRQSCSEVQLTELLMHAPSGQFVHHLHCNAGWEMKKRKAMNTLSVELFLIWNKEYMIPVMEQKMFWDDGRGIHYTS